MSSHKESEWEQGVCREIALTRRHARRGAILACALAWVTADAAHGETLRQAVEAALKTHPRVLAAVAQRRAAEQDVSQARGGYFPTLDVNAATGRERTDSPDTRALGGEANLDRRESGLLLSQKLFDGMATASEVERQNARLAVATSRLAETREDIGLRAIEAYLEVLKNRELVRLADENLKAHLDIRNKVRLRVEGGVAQKVDLQQAQGRIALANSALSARAGKLREVEANYLTVVGRLPGGDLADPAAAPSNALTSGAVNNTLLTQSVRQASETAMATNPTLSAANAEVAAAEASLRGAKAPYFPRLNLEFSANRNENIAGTRGKVDNEALMLVMRWNLFRGGSDRAQERAFAERRYAAIDTAANTRRDVEERVAVALYAKATSEERLAYLRDHASLSVEVLDSYKQQLDLGRRTLLDVLNAENELFTARSNLAAGRYDDLFNQYAVEAAKGTLVKSLGIAPAD